MKKEGEAVAQEANQYNRYGTVLLANRGRPTAWPSKQMEIGRLSFRSRLGSSAGSAS